MIFLKLGGSLITDKTGVEAARLDIIARLAQEIAEAREERPLLRLLLGHGAGSYGHVAAAKYGTRDGVEDAADWFGFVEVQAAVARLNRLVVEALLKAGVPALTVQPSLITRCENGRIAHIAPAAIHAALDAGLVPVIYGDVAFDAALGGTIVSTEELMTALTKELRPSRLLLAGETEGVYDQQGVIIPTITPANFAGVQTALGASRGADVTGGMASKVTGALQLTSLYPSLAARVFSGLRAGAIKAAVLRSGIQAGTLITSVDSAGFPVISR